MTPPRVNGRMRRFVENLPGILLCGTLAAAAAFAAREYGGPELLYALLLGLAFNFLGQRARLQRGVDLCARELLRAGVALLGFRITLGEVAALGTATATLVLLAVATTVLLGLLLARIAGRHAEEGLLTGVATGVCGASAALAVASVLPPTQHNQRFTLMVVVAVTLMSTVAMATHPLLAHAQGLDAQSTGIFLGGTIHDVAQVVAASTMAVGPAPGAATGSAVLVKLFRVLLLVPIVLLVAACFGSRAAASDSGGRRFPRFIAFFMLFAACGTLGLLPLGAGEAAASASRALLVVAISAAGVRTRFQDVARLGWLPVAMLAAETVWIALVMGAGLRWR